MSAGSVSPAGGPAGGPAARVVLRQSGTVLVPAAVWLFCGLATADAVVEGSAGFAARTTLVMLAVSFAAWMVLASPCLVVQRDGLRIVNPLRTHWVPFAALDLVHVGGLTSVTARHPAGQTRRITSWNAPGVPRRYEAATPPVAVVIERFRAAWESRAGGLSAPASTVSSWRWRPAVLLVSLVAANIAIWLR